MRSMFWAIRLFTMYLKQQYVNILNIVVLSKSYSNKNVSEKK